MSLGAIQPVTTGRCRICGRPLKCPASIERGVGPICGQKNIEGRSVMDNELVNLTEPRVFDVQLGRITGVAQTNVPHSVILHSPDGFEWGYGGSGPADLALNILNAYIPPGWDGHEPVTCFQGDASRTAYDLHQDFKWAHIATLPPEGGTLEAALIKSFLLEKIGYF